MIVLSIEDAEAPRTATELGSILENAAKLGAPIPAALIQGLGRLKKKVDQQELVPNEAENPEAAAPSLPVPDSGTEDDVDDCV